MTDATGRSTELAQRVLEELAGRAEGAVYARTGTSALTRFANSFIHQNVSDDVAALWLTVAKDGRIAQGSTTSTSPEAIKAWVDATIATAESQAPDEDWAGFTPKTALPEVDHFDEETASADPSTRAKLVKSFVDAGDGLLGAGMCETEAFEDAFVNTEGHSANGRWTKVVLDGIHQTGTTAGSGHSSGPAIGGIDALAAGQEAASRARRGLNAFDAKPDRYEVVLAPEAVATIGEFLMFYGFNGLFVNQGMSFVKPGEERFDALVDFYDDVTDDRSIGVGFDAEGTPKEKVVLIDRGVTGKAIHNRKTGKAADATSTGHAFLPAEGFGGFPVADNLYFGPGERTEDQLIANVERGIYVATFNYCRVLDPKTIVVTGLTRNGTYMIENGAITGAVTNMRFTQSFLDALAPGNVGGFSSTGRFANGEFGPATVNAPSLHLKSWNMTGGADG
jgi:predicted Zn-dependent protease